MSRLSPTQIRQLLDGALDGTLDVSGKDQLTGLFSADPALRESFASERRVLASLKEVHQPRDLTGPILAGIQRQRSFLSRSARLRVWAGRGAIAAGLLLAVSAVVFFERIYPAAAPWTAGPGPVAAVENNVRFDAANGIKSLADAGNVLQGRVAGPLAPNSTPRMQASRRPDLPMGDTSSYGNNLTFRVANDSHSPSGGISARQSRAWAKAAGVPDSDDAFVVTVARWTDRGPSFSDHRALRSDWEAGAAMRMHDDAASVDRSWWLRFWMNAQPAPGEKPDR